MTPPTTSFDARPLTEPVDPRAVRAFAAEMRARRSSGITAAGIIGIIVAVLVVLAILPIFGLIAYTAAHEGLSVTALVLVVIILIVVLFIGAVAWAGWRSARVKRYRLSRFAAANGMSYEDRIDSPGLPGMIFGIGSGRRGTELVRGASPRFVEFGNYQYTVRHGKSSTTYHWGYVAVRLDAPLPNIVLDALGNNSVFGTNLPTSFRKDQKLSLEGDFDRYFTLYCPEWYEQDALYLFTPDIMARFIDNAAQLDVEIVDDWLFLYTRRTASTLDPATWAWLFGVVGALLTKLDQWSRWRDERLVVRQITDAPASAPRALPFSVPAGPLTPPPGVAPQGRRLRRSTKWVPIAVAIVLGLLWFWGKTLS